MPKNKTKILIIEDEVEMARMYKDKLQEQGFKVVLALTAEEGLTQTKKEKPDLIILDILLPTTNGISFLAKVKKDPTLSKIPVVALSNYDEPQTKKEARELGAEDYLIKTAFTPEQLVKEIEKHLP